MKKARYYIDGIARPDSQNTFSSVCYYGTKGLKDARGVGDRWGTADLREFLRDQHGITDPQTQEFDVTVPNGKRLSMRLVEEGEPIPMIDLDEHGDIYRFRAAFTREFDGDAKRYRQGLVEALAFLFDTYACESGDSEEVVEHTLDAFNAVGACVGLSLSFALDMSKPDDDLASDSFVIIDLRNVDLRGSDSEGKG